MHTAAIITTDAEGGYEFVTQKDAYNVYLKPPRQSEEYVWKLLLMKVRFRGR
ncbi:hypothetical protein [Providencia alcalifaciens]